MAVDVNLTKVIISWDDPAFEFPYTATLFAEDADTGDPLNTSAVNSGGTADVDVFVTNTASAATWAIVN